MNKSILLLVLIGVSVISALTLERRETQFYKKQVEEWKSLAFEARDVASNAVQTAERSKRAGDAWQKAAIMCAEKLGVHIEVTGPTNVVISTLPSKRMTDL